jgi:hypothetical protein
MIAQYRSLVSEIRYFCSFGASFGLRFRVYMCLISAPYLVILGFGRQEVILIGCMELHE